MELQQFITQSLVEISRGVIGAQDQLRESGAMVNPAMSVVFPNSGGNSYESFGWAERDQASPVFLVEFDVAVTAAEGTQTKGGIGVVAGVFALGSQGQSHDQNTAVSRLQFKVPLKLPAQDKKTDA